MSRSNSPAAKARKKANHDHWGEALEGFAGQYELDFNVFGNGIHYRISNQWSTLDCWPTTGKYYVKEVAMGLGFFKGEIGHLPWDYQKLDKFLRAFFKLGPEGK